MNVENEELPMYIVQNAELLQAEALGVVTEGWGDRSTDSMWVDQEWWMADRGEPESDNDEAEETSSDDTDLDSDEECPILPPPDTLYKETWDIGSPEPVRQPGWFRCPKGCSEVRAIHVPNEDEDEDGDVEDADMME